MAENMETSTGVKGASQSLNGSHMIDDGLNQIQEFSKASEISEAKFNSPTSFNSGPKAASHVLEVAQKQGVDKALQSLADNPMKELKEKIEGNEIMIFEMQNANSLEKAA